MHQKHYIKSIIFGACSESEQISLSSSEQKTYFMYYLPLQTNTHNS